MGKGRKRPRKAVRAAPTPREVSRQVGELLGAGLRLHQAGDLAKAEILYRQALNLAPDNAEVLHLLGLVAQQLGRSEAARELISRAVVLDGARPEFHNNLGTTLLAQQAVAEAMVSYRKALELRPEYADAHNNLGAALHQLGRTDEAIASFRKAAAINPAYADAHYNLGRALQKEKRLDEAAASYETALALNPNYIEAQNNLGALLYLEGRMDEATALFHRAIKSRPIYADAHNNLGNVYGDTGRVAEAVVSYRRAIESDADHADAHHNMSGALLRQGNFAEGWVEYEWRWRTDQFPARYPGRQWRGEELGGKTIVLYAEQGLGDTIQFLRYVPLVAARRGHVVFAFPPPLRWLVAGALGAEIEIRTGGEALPPFDFCCPLMSLPGVFGTTLETIPSATPDLPIDPDRARQWAARIGGEGFKVGVAWQGNPDQPRDRYRSFPARCLAPLAAIPGVRLISLQKGKGEEQLTALPAGMAIERLGDDFDAGPDAFVDTAAVMAHLDLVVTCDTAVAHLAGALGRPVWIALPYAADWRWLVERDDSPWYPTARLFRQTARGDWAGVFDRMATALRALTGSSGHGSVMVPVSFGELIDKITILQIKAERLSEPGQLANVRRELALLAAEWERATEGCGDIGRLVGELKEINQSLWDIEDDIRICETDNDFGPRFIALARNVYKYNDRRSRTKRKINKVLGSQIVEEKSYGKRNRQQ